jgi:hypothetical protein
MNTMDSEGIMSNKMQTMNKTHSRHTPAIQDLSTLSRTNQDDDISQDHFSFRHNQDMDQWTLSTTDSIESSPIVTQPETPEVAMLSYSFSHQLIPSTNINDTAAMFPSLSDIPAAGGIGEHAEMDFPHTHHFAQAFASSLFEYNYENDDAARGCMQDDAASHTSHHEDGQLFSTQDTWNLSLDTTNLAGAHFDHMAHVLSPPVSPPLTEASQVSASSQAAYSFPGNDDSLMSDQKISVHDAFHPLSPPLNDQDPNRFVSCFSLPYSNANLFPGLSDPLNKAKGHSCLLLPLAPLGNQTRKAMHLCQWENHDRLRTNPRLELPGTTRITRCQPRMTANTTAPLPMERTLVATHRQLRSVLISKFYFSTRPG